MAEMTVEEKLKQMFQLQMVDSELNNIEVLKGELPMEVKDLEDDIAGLEMRLQRQEHTIEDMKGHVNQHEANIKEAQMLIERYKIQMDEVKNNREYEALTKEIDLQGLEIQLSEKKIKRVKEDIAKKEETRNATLERKEKKSADLEVKKEELNKILEKTQKDEEKLTKKSNRLRKKVEPRFLKAYDKIRTTYRNGLAVVQIERNSCGGCYNKIPPQLQLEVAQRNKVIACEHCGRILVDKWILHEGPIPVEEEEKPKKRTRRKRAAK